MSRGEFQIDLYMQRLADRDLGHCAQVQQGCFKPLVWHMAWHTIIASQNVIAIDTASISYSDRLADRADAHWSSQTALFHPRPQTSSERLTPHEHKMLGHSA